MTPASRPASGFDAIRGYTRLVFDGVERITSLVEAMHHNIARLPLPLQRLAEAPAPGITGFVYASIRGTTLLVRDGVDTALGLVKPLLPVIGESAATAAWRAAVNGVLGDHLAASANPLAISMCFRHAGRALPLERKALAAAMPEASGKLLVAVHGLCMHDLHWTRTGHSHACALGRDLGFSVVHLHYNSGRRISDNGREFAALLEQLVDQWPVKVESLTVLAHSMGGLLTRSACHYAQMGDLRWPQLLRQIAFLGTPHHGAPLERRGNQLQLLVGISPYTAPLARLGMLRSAGVTDLRYGNLLDEDGQHCDRFAPGDDCRVPVPLPAGVKVFAAAASLGQREGDLKDRWLGDGLVPMDSALGRHRDPTRHLSIPTAQHWLGFGMSHWDLLSDRTLYAQLRTWLE